MINPGISAGGAAGQLAGLATGLHAAGVSFEQLQRDQVQLVDFEEYFRAENEKMFRRQSDLWRPIIEDGTRHELYFEGFQALTKGPGGYKVKEVSEENRHRIFVVNRIRPFSNEQAAMWMGVNPKINVIIKDDDPTREQRRIDAADALRDHLNYLWLTSDKLQRWAKHAQFHGRYRAELWFDHDSKRGVEMKPVYQQIPGQEPMAMDECLECGDLNPTSPAQPMNGCQGCGSPYVQRHEIPGVEGFQEPAGHEYQEAGEAECIFDPTWAARFDLIVGKDLSPWFYHERDEVKESVEYKYDTKLPAQALEMAQVDEILHPGRILRRAEQQRSRGLGVGGQDDQCVLIQRFYYEPDMLHFVALKNPVKIRDMEIPANVRLSEVFQKTGMCIKTAPGVKTFLEVYPESHKKRFIEGEYDISPGRSIARGNKEAPDYNKWTNVLLSGAFDGALKTLQPSLAVVDEVFPDGRLFNREDRTIRVKIAQLKTLGENANINNALGLVPSPPMNSGIADLLNLFTSEQRRITGSETYLNAEDQGVKPNTATAANIGEDRNDRNNSLQLANFALFIVRLMEGGFDLYKENMGDARLISASDEEKRRRVVKELKRADLEGSYELHCERDSWLPDLKHKQRAAYAEGVGLYLQAVTAGIATPQFVKKLNQVYSIDIMADRKNERIADCEEILEEMQQLAPTVFSPDELYARNPVNPFDPQHEVKALWWQEVMTRREARSYHPFVLAAMELYLMEHALGYMQLRGGLATIASIGQGLIAPPVSSGLSAGEQKPPPPPMVMGDEGASGKPPGKQAGVEPNYPPGAASGPVNNPFGAAPAAV